MTRRSPARTGEQASRGQAPAWTREPLVARQDGPYAGMWFTADDWAVRVEAARRMHDAGQRRGPALDYVVDRTATVPHPTHDAAGHAARYQATGTGAVNAA